MDPGLVARWWLVVDLLVLDVRVVESREVKISGNFLFGRHAYFNFIVYDKYFRRAFLFWRLRPPNADAPETT